MLFRLSDRGTRGGVHGGHDGDGESREGDRLGGQAHQARGAGHRRPPQAPRPPLVPYEEPLQGARRPAARLPIPLLSDCGAGHAVGEDVRRLPLGLQRRSCLAFRGVGAAPGECRLRRDVPGSDGLAACGGDVVVAGGVVDGAAAVVAASGSCVYAVLQGWGEVSEAEEEAPGAGCGDVRPDGVSVGGGCRAARYRVGHAGQADDSAGCAVVACALRRRFRCGCR